MKLFGGKSRKSEKFKATHKAGAFVHYDDSKKRFAVKDKFFSVNPKKFIDVEDIKDVEVIEDGSTVSKSGLGGALVGRALLGPAGMIAGAIIGKGDKSYIEKLEIRLHLINGEIVAIPFIVAKTKTSSSVYKQNFQAFKEALQLFDAL